MTRVMGLLACVGAVLLLAAAMISGLVGVAADAATPADTVRIDAAWVRLPAVPGRPAAGYFTLRAGAQPVELVAVASPLARVELHSTSMAGGVMKMDPLPSARVAPRDTLAFASGGNHLMLFDLAATVQPGGTVPLTFKFADGTAIRVDAVARAASDGSPMSMDHGVH